MDFTEVYRAKSACFSPDGLRVLAVADNRVVVRQADTFQITHTWVVGDSSPTSSSGGATAGAGPSKSSGSRTGASTSDSIQAAWSCDSRYILAALPTTSASKSGPSSSSSVNAVANAGIVQVFDVRDKAWTATINIGIEGLSKAVWAPDARSILCFSEWGLRVTIWSLVSSKSTYIQFPKFPGRGYAFSDDTRYFVLAERHKSRDTMGIYDARDGYKLLRHFPLPTTSLASFSLSPTSEHIAVWEGPLEYKVYILNLAGQVLGSFVPDPDPGLGIRCISWHPNGSMLAVGGWDDKFYVLDNVSWRPIVTFELRSRVPASVVLWREPAGWLEATHGRGFISHDGIATPTTLLVKQQSATAAGSVTANGTVGVQTGGVVQLEWNASGSLLLARWEHCSETVHIYAFPRTPAEFKPALRTVMQQRSPVRTARWNPGDGGRASSSLVACTGSGGLYMWRDSNPEWMNDEEVAECVGIPGSTKGFGAGDVQWGPDGRSLVLLDRERFACAFVVDEE